MYGFGVAVRLCRWMCREGGEVMVEVSRANWTAVLWAVSMEEVLEERNGGRCTNIYSLRRGGGSDPRRRRDFRREERLVLG